MDTIDDVTPILATPDHAIPPPAPAVAEPRPLNPKHLAASLVALGATPPDEHDEPGAVRGAWRDVNSRGNGTESYRRRLSPGAQSWGWLSDERLPRGTFLASDRRAVIRGDAFVGDLLAVFSRGLRGGSSTGKATLDGFEIYCGRGGDGKFLLPDCDGKKKRDGSYSVMLPTGRVLIVPSPAW